jgi:predicted nucleotidyltransferase component of viral defense system
VLPDTQALEDISIELGVAPSFIEKDWHAVRVLSAIAEIEADGIQPIFSGGTCLSKAHKILKRFSEYLDFRGYFIPDKCHNRNARRSFRETVLSAVEAVSDITLDRGAVESGSSYFKFPLNYKQQFEIPGGLRPDLQIEFSYTQPKQGTESKAISSFVTEFSRGEPETEILCLSPIETGADKFCALTWRVLKRDRDDEGDDPAMIRHLHDLCALRSIILDQTTAFSETAAASFEIDMQLGNRRLDLGLIEAAKQALDKLRSDTAYKEEYEMFVAGMSYAREDEKINFETALNSFEEITSLIK